MCPTHTLAGWGLQEKGNTVPTERKEQYHVRDATTKAVLSWEQGIINVCCYVTSLVKAHLTSKYFLDYILPFSPGNFTFIRL